MPQDSSRDPSFGSSERNESSGGSASQAPPAELPGRLRQAIAARRRVVVIGVGSELHGDDAAGLLLSRAIEALALDHLRAVHAGTAPESITGEVRALDPEIIILADAVRTDAASQASASPYASIHCWPLEDLQTAAPFTGSGSTHTLPLTTVAAYLAQTCRADVWLLGIEAGEGTLLGEVSEPVRKTVELLANALGQTAQL